MEFPTLTTERLQLTRIVDQDAQALFTLFSDPLVIEYYDIEALATLEQAKGIIALFERRYREQTGIRWGIRLNDSRELIGTCGFNAWNPNMRNATIGYELLPHFWGKGYASEAVRCALKAAFDGTLACGKLHRVQADTVPGNRGSEFVLKKLGFQLEGMRRHAGFWKGEYHDLNCYGLLKHDFV